MIHQENNFLEGISHNISIKRKVQEAEERNKYDLLELKENVLVM
jgi:hypothetical protein